MFLVVYILYSKIALIGIFGEIAGKLWNENRKNLGEYGRDLYAEGPNGLNTHQHVMTQCHIIE